MKKESKRHIVIHYLYSKLTGSFSGFVIGMMASGLVSRFFETRSIKNLWGLTSKKNLVDKDTFSTLEWIVSVVVGFIVFEIFNKGIKKKIGEIFPGYKFRIYRWIVKNELHHKLRSWNYALNKKTVVLYSGLQIGARQAFNRFSKK